MNQDTRKKLEDCVQGLRASMDLFLFDPATGESKEAHQLNDLDSMTYHAMECAADYIEKQLAQEAEERR